MSADAPIRIGVDIGGTFTDVALERGLTRVTAKVPTTAGAPERGVLDALGQALAEAGAAPGDVAIVIHGTTLATNALIERTGARTALITTEGFRDVLEMGTESRFDQYDLEIEKPAPLVPRRHRFTVPERMSAAGDPLIALDAGSVDALVPRLRDAGIESVAIAFLHGFANPAHERLAAATLGRALPDLPLSLSCEVSPEIREYERFNTTCANAYVRPLIAGYLRRLERGLAAAGFACPLFLMLSGGGITEIGTATRFPVRLIESGPAGGAVLAAEVARQCGLDGVVSFDMGGTTAKICLIDDFRPQAARGFEVARAGRFKPGSGLPLRIPVIEMVEIGAGGGSIAAVDGLRRITVGPESAGADPGPAAYANGGERATVSDADIRLGRISPDGFAGGRMRLDAGLAEAALVRDVGAALGHDATLAALGISEMVEENMANALREHAVERGKTAAGRTLVAFGGSAPIHAARLADKVGIDRIVVPRSAGVGSAVGFLAAPIAYEVARTNYQRLGSLDLDSVTGMFDHMAREAHAVVRRGAPGIDATERRLAYMRYVGQGHEIPVEVAARRLTHADAGALRRAYDAAYRLRFGRLIEEIDVEVMSWTLSVAAAPGAATEAIGQLAPTVAEPSGRRRLVDPATGEECTARVFRRRDLAAGAELCGWAVIVEDETSTVVPPAFTARIDGFGHIIMNRTADRPVERLP